MRIKTFTALLIFFSLSSCTSVVLNMALKSLKIYEDEVIVSSYKNEDKTIAYIPMKHVGTKNFYKNVAATADSLASEGFVFFLEGVRVDTLKFSKQQIDTIEFKIRKITGVNISQYLDTVNNTLMGIKYKNKKGLINQPKYSNFGITETNGKIVDVPMNLLLEEYENKFGTVYLDACDYATIRNTFYGCDKAPAKNKNYIILDYRNLNLAQKIMSSSDKKIAVLYGALHENGLYTELKKLDDSWKKESR